MTEIIFATNNRHKLAEVQAVLGADFVLRIPKDCGVSEEIPEEADTLEGNASQKSHYLHDRTGQNCFADDTGLEVEALDGRPGVHSARYASEAKDDNANIELLLSELAGSQNRRARFRTVISLIIDNTEYLFEGQVDGVIIDHRQGTEGFGYDPVFVPNGFDKTFAQMNMTEKNSISHRSRAVKKLVDFLKTYKQ